MSFNLFDYCAASAGLFMQYDRLKVQPLKKTRYFLPSTFIVPVYDEDFSR